MIKTSDGVETTYLIIYLIMYMNVFLFNEELVKQDMQYIRSLSAFFVLFLEMNTWW